jgi:hypothetical protein
MRVRRSGTCAGRTLKNKILATLIIDVSPAFNEEKSFLQNLMRLYLCDFSEIDGKRVDENIIFYYQYLDLFWKDPEVCIRINEFNGEGDQSVV